VKRTCAGLTSGAGGKGKGYNRACAAVVYMDDLITRLRQRGLGCKLLDCFYGCLVFAGDILLLAHTVNYMQSLLKICDEFALDLNNKFNGTKTLAMQNWL